MKKILLLLLFIPGTALAMDDTAIFHSGMADIDYSRADGQSVITWDGDLWIGGDFDKAVIRARGERKGSSMEHNEVQLLWSHYIARFWDVRAGYRHDFKPFKRNEAVLALTGLAPYYIDTNIALYATTKGDLRGEIELAHDLQLTQNIVAELYIDSEWNGFSDPLRQVGSGVAQLNIGTKLRYEFNRHVALYADLYLDQTVGNTRSLMQANGEKTRRAGVRGGIRLFNF